MKHADNQKPSRKRPAHGIKDVPGQPIVIFDTVCTRNRQGCLACDGFHTVFRDVMQQASAWLVGRYVIMPEHIHFFAGFTDDSDIDYESWIRYWKSQCTKRFVDAKFRWLSGHWDTRVRDYLRYAEKWEYVRNNPVRRGLVGSADEWPFQGEIHELEWR